MCILPHVQGGVSGFMHVDFIDQPQELTLGLAAQVINPCAESFLEYVKVSFLCGALTPHHTALWYRLKLDPPKRCLRPNPLHACLCDNLIRFASLLI